jgi:putative transposase
MDLKEAGVECGENRVARLMKAAQIRSVRGYKRPRYKIGRPSLVAPNQLQRQFTYEQPDQAWVGQFNSQDEGKRCNPFLAL